MEREALVLDLVEWLAPAPRPYAEVLEAWRTSCPRLTVWEDALDRGYLRRDAGPRGTMVAITPLGQKFLADHRRMPPQPTRSPARSKQIS
jgi:hypothetical protein